MQSHNISRSTQKLSSSYFRTCASHILSRSSRPMSSLSFFVTVTSHSTSHHHNVASVFIIDVLFEPFLTPCVSGPFVVWFCKSKVVLRRTENDRATADQVCRTRQDSGLIDIKNARSAQHSGGFFAKQRLQLTNHSTLSIQRARAGMSGGSFSALGGVDCRHVKCKHY